MSTYINPKKPNQMLYNDCPEILKRFLNYLKAIKNLSDRTINGYYLDLRSFFRFIKFTDNNISFDEFYKIDISDVSTERIVSINADEIYEFLSFSATILNNAVSARSRKLSAIKSFYKYCTSKANLLEVNPASDIETPKKPKKIPKFLSYEECISLLSAAASSNFAKRDLCIISLFLNCGMRLSELVNINLTDIKPDKIRIIGKGNKERFAYLNDFCRETLDDYLKERKSLTNVKEKNALFLSRFGTRITGRRVEQIMDELLSAAGLSGLGYSVHKLRHTAATQMYRSGVADVMTLREVLGHSNVSTTEIYTHISDTQVVNAINESPMNISYDDLKDIKSNNKANDNLSEDNADATDDTETTVSDDSTNLKIIQRI